MDAHAVIEQLKSQMGQLVGVSDWIHIDQTRINQFADCTEDRQWIHVDAERAAQGPFGKTIAHGFLTLSLVSAMSQSFRIPLDETQIRMMINYGLNQVRFINPVPVNSNIRSQVTLLNVEEKSPDRILLTYKHTIEIEGQAKPACVAETLLLLVLK